MKLQLHRLSCSSLTPLAGVIASILASTLSHSAIGAGLPLASVWAPSPAAIVVKGSARAPARPSTTYEVTSCADDGSAGTLRYVIEHAGDGDTADLSSLTCSTITLANGELQVPANNFTITAATTVTIDAHRASRVIEHDGSGTLYLHAIQASNGYFKYNSGNGTAKGGCVLSNGMLRAVGSQFTDCEAVNTNGTVLGGAIYTLQGGQIEFSSISGSTASGIAAFGGGLFSQGPIGLAISSISGNTALSSSSDSHAFATGGGVVAEGYAQILQTSFIGNQANASHASATGGGLVADSGLSMSLGIVSGNSATSPRSSAGGLQVSGNSYVHYSTIDHNTSYNNAAMVVSGAPSASARLVNCTVSGNAAEGGSSAIFASIPIHLDNSTIAFNTASGSSAGLYLYSGSSADLESTILSNNTSSAGGGFDLVANATVTGAHNLVQSPGSTVPGDTLVGVDPLLEPLALNGASTGTETHALSPSSLAIDRGINPLSLQYDQRGAGFGRVYGSSADIGSYEWQGNDTDTIFQDSFE